MRDSISILESKGCPHITLLHCVSEYPAQPEDFNLASMLNLKKYSDDISIGLSDHSPGHTIAVAATALGARVIEKHFTLLQTLKCLGVENNEDIINRPHPFHDQPHIVYNAFKYNLYNNTYK